MTDIEARIDAAANELCNDELRPADEIRDIIRKHFYADVAEKNAEIEQLVKALDDNWVTHQQIIASREQLADRDRQIRLADEEAKEQLALARKQIERLRELLKDSLHERPSPYDKHNPIGRWTDAEIEAALKGTP